MDSLKVPFNDLSRIHNPLRQELDNAWKRVVDNHSFVLGKEVETFGVNTGRHFKNGWEFVLPAWMGDNSCRWRACIVDAA